MFLLSWLTKGVHMFFKLFHHRSSSTVTTNGTQTAGSSTNITFFAHLRQQWESHRSSSRVSETQTRNNNQRGGLQEAFRELIESLRVLLEGINSQARNPLQNIFPRRNRRQEDTTGTNGNNNSITKLLMKVIQALLKIVIELVRALGPNNNTSTGTSAMTSNPGIGFNNDPSPGSIPSSFGGFGSVGFSGYGNSHSSTSTSTDRRIGNF